MDKPTDLYAAKRRRERRKYADSVLDAWDDLEHRERREARAQKSKVERESRRRL